VCYQERVGQGGKATLATAPDADILREIVCLLTQRVRAGRATFLIKVKSHRGEPINERADTLAEKGREISDDDKRWDDRTDRMTFEVRKGDTTVRIHCGVEVTELSTNKQHTHSLSVDEQRTRRLPKTTGVG
jgi:hypothetical protein